MEEFETVVTEFFKCKLSKLSWENSSDLGQRTDELLYEYAWTKHLKEGGKWSFFFVLCKKAIKTNLFTLYALDM